MEKCWHPLSGHGAFIWHSEISAFKPVSWAEKALKSTTWVLPGVEGLPRAAGSDFWTASSCLLLLPSVGPPLMLPGLPRLIFRLWECLLKWVTKLGLYIQSSFQDLTSFPSRASWVHSLSWLAFKVTSPRVNCNRTHHLWVGGLPPPWMMCGEQPWDALTHQSFWASPGSIWVYAHPEKPSLSREVTMKSLPVINWKFTHPDQYCVYISICN